MIFLTANSLSATGTYQIPVVQTDEEGTLVPARAVSYYSLTKFQRKQIDCLTENIYREAGYEPKVGWVAVAFVTMNRLFSGNYADSVCGVVYQKTGATYQFSWVGERNLPRINGDLYTQIQRVATAVYLDYNRDRDITHGATYYHADYVQPGWTNLQKTRKIGAHIFYRSNKDGIT
jgi:spore germination cell wall hydrolase CwlJ-like protein